MRLSALIKLPIVAGLLAIVGCGVESSNQPNLLIITLDTTRADHLGCYGYFRNTSPTIDAIARESILFERCYSPIATTLPAHTSLLTGIYPLEHGITANPQDGGLPFVPTENLRSYAGMLLEAGYRTGAFVSALPLADKSGISSGFETFDQPEAARRRGVDTNRAAFRWLDRLDDRPFLLWVHYFDPHGPTGYPAPPDTAFVTDEDLETLLEARAVRRKKTVRKTGKVVDTREMTDWYDSQIHTMDSQIGLLLDKVSSVAPAEETIVVIVGDHGEGLGQHNVLHHERIWVEQVHVPLIIRAPGHEAQRIQETVSIIDILPTVLALNPALPAGTFHKQARGRDALSPARVSRSVFSQESMREVEGRDWSTYSLTTDKWKYVYRTSGVEMLYHLKDDPFELADLAENRRDVTARFRAELDSLVRSQKTRASFYRKGGESVPAIRLSPDEEASMRALGYVD